ncbi:MULTISPECIES: glycosyltransferase family 9 protein [Bacillus]|uniref:glycosyltransferase family 9 protein n=1 Tax=Bacillus TaxID=1386 RepID=UPI0002DC73D9|nr:MULTISPECIES: glycosyltransferase family 9 protein [Bacillus]
MEERGNAKLKLIDKYIGIPIVFLLGMLRGKKEKKILNPKSIIIVMIAAIGDTILLSSIIKEIKHRYPNSNITIVCSNENAQAAKNIPYINRMIKFNMSSLLGSFILLRKETPYDLLLDFGAWSRLNAIISFVIKANIKVGFKRKKMFRHYIYDRTAEHLDSIHELENYRNVLRSLEFNLIKINPEFLISKESKEKIGTLLDSKNKFIIFHLFASGSHKEIKQWTESSWIELANRLIREGYKIILTGGRQDSELANEIVQKMDCKGGTDCISLAGKLSLEETAALIEEVNIIVTVNTGIMHLAAAVGSSIIALHGPTSPLRWGPVSEKSVILTPRIKCDHLLSLGFEKHRCVVENGCISTIHVNDVYSALKNKENNLRRLS